MISEKKYLNPKLLNIKISILLIFLLLSFFGCSKDDNSLAPYVGSPAMSDIVVQSGSFKPAVTWIGGYVSVFAVNRGNKAALDSTLVWLIHSVGNNIHYPVTFGVLPEGAEDLTAQFGGSTVDSLSEDNTYTYWVLKEDVWNQISSQKGKVIEIDSSQSGSLVQIIDDTLKVNNFSCVKETQNLDVYINIDNISTFGRLGIISIEIMNSNNPVISWEITQDGVTDSLISAIGISEGGQYDATKLIWEVFSEEDSAGVKIYGKKNLIKSPVTAGESFTGTHVFAEYPAAGLERNKTYYLWIANKDWDGATRLRFASGYAYLTFNTK